MCMNFGLKGLILYNLLQNVQFICSMIVLQDCIEPYIYCLHSLWWLLIPKAAFHTCVWLYLVTGGQYGGASTPVWHQTHGADVMVNYRKETKQWC
jgi:hypothetical protein